MIKLFVVVAVLAFLMAGNVNAFETQDTNGVVLIRTANYLIQIVKSNFCYGFLCPNLQVIAPANSEFGLEFGGGHSVSASLETITSNTVTFDVHNESADPAKVKSKPC